MAHYFTNFPSVEYDLGRTGFPRTIQNPLVRFKLLDILKSKSALYYEHIVEEGQSAQFIADNYYEDVTLDWVIYLVNDVYDTLYDWPMDYQVFTEFLRSKYDSVEKALNTVHQYEHIIQKQTVLFDHLFLQIDSERDLAAPKNSLSNGLIKFFLYLITEI